MMKKHPRQAQALATPFTKVAKAIAKNHGVRVVPSNGKCCTDGTTISVPFAAEIAEGAPLQTLNGMLDHELGHVLVEEDCKQRGIPGFIERMNTAARRGDRTLAVLMNIVEDVRIEIDLGREYPGMKDNLARLNERQAGFRRAAAARGQHESLWREITCGFISRARGFDDSWLTPKASAYLDGCEDLVEKSRHLGGVVESVALASELKHRLHEIADERREEEKERRKEERERERKEDDECEDGDEDDDPSNVDHAGELGAEPPSPEEGEDGEQAEGSSEGEEDGGDEGDAPQDDGDPSKGSGGGAGGSDDSDAEGDESKGKATSGDDGSGSDDSDTEGDESKGKATSGDGSDDSDTEGEGDFWGEEDEEEDEGEDTPGDLDEGPDFTDHRDELRDELDKDLVESARARGITLPHPSIAELDVWRKASEDKHSEVYSTVKDEVRGQIGALRQKQIARIQTQARSRLHVGLDDGDLDQSRLHEVAMGATDVHQEIRPGRQVNVAIEVLLDLSGSIHGRCEYFMRRTLVALAESWEPIRGMSYEIVGFHNFFPGRIDLPRRLHGLGLGMQDDGVHYVRMPFEMIVFKEYNERISAFRNRFGEVSAHQDNCDHEAVWMVAKRLAQRPEERKILVVINDGSPQSSGVPGHVLNGGLRDTVRTITRAGIEVWGIGAGTDSPKRFYNADTGARNVCISNLDTMASTLLSLFAKRIEAAA